MTGIASYRKLAIADLRWAGADFCPKTTIAGLLARRCGDACK
jgi:hypothetical protein